MDMGTGLVRAVVVLILSAWAAPLFSQGCPITITGASFSPSLRLMTFNAAIQVFPGDTEDLFGMSFEQRAALIADRVKAEDPDVVLLTEVNQDDSKWVMMDHLQDTFPSYMHVLDADNLLNDSGMMLFSKYVFLTGGGLKSVNGHAGGENQGQHFDFSWVLFSGEDSNGGDYWANKGVGMVRIDNECFPGEVFYVAFTHTQADGSTTQPAGAAAEDFEDRQAQLGKVREVIEATVPPGRRLRDPVFLMGDLNVNGNRFIAPPPLVPFWSGASWEERPWTEWQYIFASTDPAQPIDDQHRGFFACDTRPCTYDPSAPSDPASYLVDAWAYGTSPLDPGQTNSGDNTGGSLSFPKAEEGQRLDYILHNRPQIPAVTGDGSTRGLCLQHIVRGFRNTSVNGGAENLSDHLPVTADFNLQAPRCSPYPHRDDSVASNLFGPEPVAFDAEDPTASNHKLVGFDGTVTFPGSMQWYLIDQAYPVEIGLTGFQVGYEVYQGADLSNPIAPFNGDCELTDSSFACKYTLYDPPYYVRVYGTTGHPSDPTPDRTRAGQDYTIRFQRYTCSSIEDACPLLPAVTSGPWVWPETLLNPTAQSPDQDTMFFEFLSERSSTGGWPEVTFAIDSSFAVAPNPLTLSLIRKNGALACPVSECPAGDGLLSQSPGIDTWGPDANGDGLPERVATARAGTLPGSVSWPEPYYLKVRRSPLYLGQQQAIHVRFETDLNYFRPIELYCAEEETDFGLDVLRASFTFDDLEVVEGLPQQWDNGMKLVEAGTANWFYSWPFELDGSMLEHLIPGLDDMNSDGTVEDHLFSVTDGFSIDALPKQQRADQPPHLATYKWTDDVSPADADYLYVMTYQLTHSRPPCRGEDPFPNGDCRAPFVCRFGACQMP